eukprot:TRINITY_DN44155_c0_g1_i1.p1 TRINITY_DN44155_c0_g1~~TRINITY_DN44155_c0_g1_i1.p1  ORF type:complete len:274 (+),score=36.12 TRINITY_DN44155_c0_g1_i1:90-911(+)
MAFHQMQQESGNPSVAAQKVSAFRDLASSLASSLASQIVEQLTSEYEKSVTSLLVELTNYRTELAGVTDLLGKQLGRERQLHEMLDAMSNHHNTITAQAQAVAQQQPNSKEIHELVDRMVGQHSSIIHSTLQGMTQVHSAAQVHAAQAKLLEEPMHNAEQEFSRVMSMLHGQTSPMQSMGCGMSASPPPPGRIFPAPQSTHQQVASTQQPSPRLGGQVSYRQIPSASSPQNAGANTVHGGCTGNPYTSRSPSPPAVHTPPHPGTFLGGSPAFA